VDPQLEVSAERLDGHVAVVRDIRKFFFRRPRKLLLPSNDMLNSLPLCLKVKIDSPEHPGQACGSTINNYEENLSGSASITQNPLIEGQKVPGQCTSQIIQEMVRRK
jgi:hypothetical protein